jgi:hypothetical protein
MFSSQTQLTCDLCDVKSQLFPEKEIFFVRLYVFSECPKEYEAFVTHVLLLYIFVNVRT